MKINIYNNSDSLKYKSTEIKRNILEIVNKFELTKADEVEIIFVDKAKIKKLNAKYRKKNLATDVLSFPQSTFNTKLNMLGSIVICDQVVKEKGEDLIDVVKHGFLHLLGFDHENNLKEWESASKKIKCAL